MAKKKRSPNRLGIGRIGFIPIAIGCKVLSGYGFTAGFRAYNAAGGGMNGAAAFIDTVANTSPSLAGMLVDTTQIGFTGLIYKKLPKMNVLSTRWIKAGP